MKFSKPKLFFLICVGILSLIAILVYINRYLYRTKASVTTTAIHGTGTYTDWNWPGQNFTNFTWLVTPNHEQTGPDAYFYSHQFGFVSGSGGYSGLQGDLNGKRAIFSIWEALSAQGPQIAQPFGGEGIGYQTIIDYQWVAGRTYKFRLEVMEKEADGTWWGSTVTDQTTGTSSFIGKIKVPKTWENLNNWSIVWTERYGGENTRCSDIHYSSVNFTSFTANNGSIVPSSRNNHLGNPPGCPGSVITDIAGGVLHEMGVGNPLPPIITKDPSTYLSDLEWSYATTGYAQIQKDMAMTGNGRLIMLNGQRYQKGLGVHANSDIRYNLEGKYTSFRSDIGLDDYVGTAGSAVFQVWADGTKLYDSGIMTGSSQTQNLALNVSNKQELKLIVTDAGDNIHFDAVDWANARLLAQAISPSPTIVPANTSLAVSLLLHGIGSAGDSVNPTGGGNTNPQRTQRTVQVEVFNSQNQLVAAKTGQLNFEASSGSFKGTIDLGSTIPTGVYSIKLKSDQFLKSQVEGIQTITKGQINQLPITTLVTGDINGDNKIDITDYNLLLGCYSDFLPPLSCTASNKIFADITDDSNVNQFDYNLFLRELTNIAGQ